MTSQFENRLAGETSPYLLQHSRNPVDWQPWDAESLALAKKHDRPIFLSIGYSACHWCHVMEHESFEDPAIADLMNAGFVNIKVDREERPDLDQIYMNAVMAMTGSGGWPMSVFLTPDQQPFFGGTYWPPTARWGRPGFREILIAVQDAWQNRRDAVLHQASELTENVIQSSLPSAERSELGPDVLRNAWRSLLRSADRVHGGFGTAPKFPHPMDLRVLLRCSKRFENAEARAVVSLTLDKMSQGGIYDHLGGGFARYSTDERWLVPHFEKMLYDNAQLVTVYLEAYQQTKDANYLQIVRETLDYVLREMQQPEGGFYATQDADSEGVEGKFFVWSEADVLQILGPDDGPIFCDCYDVSAAGNWEHQNILNRPANFAERSQRWKKSATDLENLLARCRQTLFKVRQQRVPPARDDKILVGWNGLMIAAMAQAGAILEEPKYIAAATSAVEFILTRMTTEGSRLWHCWKDGRARFNGYLDDYASLIEGLTELAQVTFDCKYLDQACRFANTLIAQFHDNEAGGFFYTATDHETLIARQKETHDNATPSGNNLAATALLKLARITGRGDLEAIAVETLDMISGTLSRMPMAVGQALIGVDFLIGPTYELVIIDGEDLTDGDRILSLIRHKFLPNQVVWRHSPKNAIPECLKPLLSGKTPLQNRVTMYVCQAETCQSPVAGIDEITTALDRL